LASIIRSSKLSALDRIFGFVFGMARGVLIIILIALMFSTLIPGETQKGAFAESKIYKQASACVEPLKAMIPQSWIDSFKAKSESLGFGKDEKAKPDEAATKDESKPEETKQETPAENKSGENADKKPGLHDALEFIDNNLDVLQQNGEELFNQLAQPKTTDETTSENKEGNSSNNGIASDLDKILDVLEDVVTDEQATEVKPSAPQMKNSISEFNNPEPTIEDVIDKEIPDTKE
jgi:hypothetical protein